MGRRDGAGRLPFSAVVAIAMLVAALAGVAIYLGVNGALTLRSLVGLTLVGGMPIALTLTGLAGPTLARAIIGKRPVDWSGAGLLGIAIAVAPGMLALCTVVPIRFCMTGEAMELRGWLGGLLALTVAGCIGGLTFRWLHGDRPVP